MTKSPQVSREGGGAPSPTSASARACLRRADSCAGKQRFDALLSQLDAFSHQKPNERVGTRSRARSPRTTPPGPACFSRSSIRWRSRALSSAGTRRSRRTSRLQRFYVARATRSLSGGGMDEADLPKRPPRAPSPIRRSRTARPFHWTSSIPSCRCGFRARGIPRPLRASWAAPAHLVAHDGVARSHLLTVQSRPALRRRSAGHKSPQSGECHMPAPQTAQQITERHSAHG